MADEKKMKALEAALAKIHKDHGNESLMRLEGDALKGVKVVPTGSLALDVALGVGGVPRGRVVEIFGPESSGKTTFCYEVIAGFQREGGICAFIDSEHAMDPTYAKNVGVNIGELLVSQPDNGEQALNIAEDLVRSGAVELVVIDSVAALVPKAELEGEMGDAAVGLQARLMSKACRKLVSLAREQNCTIIFTNQLRHKIGVMFGSPETTPGGMALKFYATVRLDIRRIATNKDGSEATGNRVRVKVVKNKVAPPFRQAEFDIRFGEGFDNHSMILEMASDPKVGLDLIQKSGAYYTFPDGVRVQGGAKARQHLIDNPDVMAEVEGKVRAVMLPKPEDVAINDAMPAEDEAQEEAAAA